ncbi:MULTISPECIES: hypothetical protein [unclassified Nocardiopsis]|uniref:hypothetical protein n=1 Tax=unclassified Nocardiopsis TaxID=2649073 RepID=UPI00066E9B11|nr:MULTISPECIES: hypothetical protein [unclassified Nocardiopsis]MBQ1083329.1 hypothetical protein [Nocardiopsis sp. B62]
MNQYPDPPQGEPWQQPSGGTPGWGQPPEQHTGGQLEPYGAPTGGYQPHDGGMPHEPTLDTIGDIAITQNTVITPSGRFPIQGTVWTISDMSRTERTTPVWAIIVAILIFWWTCLLGLLILLVKEDKTTGHVQVTVQGGGHYHATQILVSNRSYVQHVNQQVNYARSLAS